MIRIIPPIQHMGKEFLHELRYEKLRNMKMYIYSWGCTLNYDATWDSWNVEVNKFTGDCS
jgi:hypothetical protein